METGNKCYLCSLDASIEDVPKEHGQRFDVLCKGKCPRYIITQSAINELARNTNIKKEFPAKIMVISKAGKQPVIRFDDMKRVFIFTSKEGEQ